MVNHPPPRSPVRKQLDHSAHFHGRFGATYFITICCQLRGLNQLCNERIASTIFETARRYHASQRCYVKLLLLPDHLHMLIGVPGNAQLSRSSVILSESRREWRRSIGNEISSIIDCGMMRAWRKNLNTFVKIQSARTDHATRRVTIRN
jgi:REP element-mobilizing transposase RayT